MALVNGEPLLLNTAARVVVMPGAPLDGSIVKVVVGAFPGASKVSKR